MLLHVRFTRARIKYELLRINSEDISTQYSLLFKKSVINRSRRRIEIQTPTTKEIFSKHQKYCTAHFF